VEYTIEGVNDGIDVMIDEINKLQEENINLKRELAKYKGRETLNPCKICGSSSLDIRGVGFNTCIKCLECNNMRGGFSERETLIRIWNGENITE
jgi:hypothetical protein